MCELYTMSGEVNKFKRIAIVYSLKAMYYAINVDKALVSQENLPITVNKIDSKMITMNRLWRWRCYVQ